MLVIGAHMFSRWCACGVMWRLPYVRSGEDSKAASFADRRSGLDWMVSGALGAAAVAPFVMFPDGMPHVRVYPVLAAAVGASALTAVAAALYFRRRIGGYTGDCLGAVQQVTELVFLLAALVLVAPSQRTG
jgi:adenosylcobinamide-GDP ribazoletransferase